MLTQRQWLCLGLLTVLLTALAAYTLPEAEADDNLSNARAALSALVYRDYTPAPPPAPGAAVPVAVINAQRPGMELDLTPYVVAGKLTLFDFYSEFCGPCLQLAPQLEQLTRDFPAVVVRTIDINRPGVRGIDWQSPLAKQYTLTSIPHLVLVDTAGVRHAVSNGLAGLEGLVPGFSVPKKDGAEVLRGDIPDEFLPLQTLLFTPDQPLWSEAHLWQGLFSECGRDSVTVQRTRRRGEQTVTIGADYRGDAAPDFRVVATYRNNRLLQETMDRDNDGTPDLTRTLQYDRRGRVTENRLVFSAEMHPTVLTYAYAPGGALQAISEECTGDSTAEAQVTLRETRRGTARTVTAALDTDGDSAAERSYARTTGARRNQITLSEDRDGDGSSDLITVRDGATERVTRQRAGKPLSVTTRRFDENGRILLFTRDREADGTDDYRLQYSYAARGRTIASAASNQPLLTLADGAIRVMDLPDTQLAAGEPAYFRLDYDLPAGGEYRLWVFASDRSTSYSPSAPQPAAQRAFERFALLRRPGTVDKWTVAVRSDSGSQQYEFTWPVTWH